MSFGAFVGNLVAEVGGKAASAAEQKTGDLLEGAGARIAERISDNPQVQQAVERIGAVASKPTKQELTPVIVLVGAAVVVSWMLIAHQNRR